MKPARIGLHALLAAALGACALVPQHNLRLEEARTQFANSVGEPLLTTHAPGEYRSAREAMDEANAAWSTLQDVALVDHLSYLARKRLQFAWTTARRRSLEELSRP